MYDTLLVTNQESPWMWAATLPLFGAIVSSIPASRGTLQATKTFRRLLREVPAKDDTLIQFFAGWRVCVSEILKIYSSVKQNNYIWARDQIIEECKRVLQQSVMSVNNVIAILSVLPVELKRVFNEFSNSADASSFDSNMRSWIVSVFEFLLPIVSLGYQATSKQIFSIDITTASVILSVARSAVWLLRQFASKDDVQYFNPTVFQGIEEWRIAKEVVLLYLVFKIFLKTIFLHYLSWIHLVTCYICFKILIKWLRLYYHSSLNYHDKTSVRASFSVLYTLVRHNL
uniref:Signal recognition particle 14 kDa protein n=1 Tax=Heterorhabditis bacteriophora TaxID=37862 RepID=A0A1I7XLP0_HETBA